jgi:hypothetical protein
MLQRHRVQFYWVISPEAASLIAYRLAGETYQVAIVVKYDDQSENNRARIPPFDEAEIDLAYIFGSQ